jgi:hypothetical protein
MSIWPIIVCSLDQAVRLATLHSNLLDTDTMDFEKAAALATAWVDILCEGRACIVRESTIAKPYGWIFFYQAKEYLDDGTESARLVGNAPIIVDRNTSELRVTGTGRPLEHYLADYEKTLPPVSLQRAPQPPTW